MIDAKLATKKVARFFRKNRGVTPPVAAPGVTHPSDATGTDWFADGMPSTERQ